MGAQPETSYYAPQPAMQNLALVDQYTGDIIPVDLMNLGLFDHKAMSGLSGKIGDMKHSAQDMGHSAAGAAHDAAHIVDTKAVSSAAAAGLHKGEAMAGQAGQAAAHGAAVGAKMGANVAGRATNYAMTSQGQAVIKDTVHNGVALGTHAATGNTLGAVNDGLNLGKDALMAGQGIAHSSKNVHDPKKVLLINLDGQYEMMNLDQYE
jgi:hypothetical protein